MSRPKTAGERNESMMVEKAKKAMETTKDPVEKLRIDDDGSKTICYPEFKKGIHDTGLELEEQGYKPPMSDARKRVIGEAFNKLDKSGDGFITIDDVRGVYDVKNHPKYLNGELTEEELYNKFLANFETNKLVGDNAPDTVGDGKITSAEFLDYYSGISASIDQDAYFDLMVRNAWKL